MGKVTTMISFVRKYGGLAKKYGGNLLDYTQTAAMVFTIVVLIGIVLFMRMRHFVYATVSGAVDPSLIYLYAISNYEIDGKKLYEYLDEAARSNSEIVGGKNLTKIMYENFGEPFVLLNSSEGEVLKVRECKRFRAQLALPNGWLKLCWSD